MHKILRRGWIGLLVFVIALTLANFLLHIVEAGNSTGMRRFPKLSNIAARLSATATAYRIFTANAM